MYLFLQIARQAFRETVRCYHLYAGYPEPGRIVSVNLRYRFWCGPVAVSALKSSGTYVDIPESWYPPIEQAAVVLSSSRQKALARQIHRLPEEPRQLANPAVLRIRRASDDDPL